jgi:hypothetical protein
MVDRHLATGAARVPTDSGRGGGQPLPSKALSKPAHDAAVSGESRKIARPSAGAISRSRPAAVAALLKERLAFQANSLARAAHIGVNGELRVLGESQAVNPKVLHHPLHVGAFP